MDQGLGEGMLIAGSFPCAPASPKAASCFIPCPKPAPPGEFLAEAESGLQTQPECLLFVHQDRRIKKEFPFPVLRQTPWSPLDITQCVSLEPQPAGLPK